MSKAPHVQGIPSALAASVLAQCTVEAVVPESADLDTLALLLDDDAPSPVSRLPQRHSLYLDEIVPIHVVLRAPFVAEHVFKAWLARLAIRLEAHAVGLPQRPPEPGRGGGRQHPAPQNVKETVDSCLVDTGSDPVIAVGTEGGDESEDGEGAKQFIYILWKEQLHISRARIRNRDMSIYLSATCSLRPSTPGTTDEVLTTGQTSSPNLFAPLSHDPSFQGHPPVLTAARLTKHTPAGFLDRDTARPIKNGTRALMRAVPSVLTRLRCTRLGGSPNTARMLASVDVEASASLRRAKVDLDSVEVLFADGKAVPLAPITLPHRASAGDSTSFLYDLVPASTTTTTARRTSSSQAKGTPAPHQHALTFRLTSTIHDADSTASILKDRAISTQWRATVDTSTLHRPPSTTTTPPTARVPTTSTSKKPAAAAAATRSTTLFAGPRPVLVLTLSAPTPTPRPGSTITWTAQLTNRTGRAAAPAPRTLHLRLVPRVDVDDADALLPLAPWLDAPPLPPGASASIALRLRVPSRAGACRFVGLCVEEHGGRGARIEVPGWMAPDVVAMPGGDGGVEDSSQTEREDGR